jgi:hypothetical protein
MPAGPPVCPNCGGQSEGVDGLVDVPCGIGRASPKGDAAIIWSGWIRVRDAARFQRGNERGHGRDAGSFPMNAYGDVRVATTRMNCRVAPAIGTA